MVLHNVCVVTNATVKRRKNNVKKNMGGILNSKPKKLYTEKDRTPKNKISDLKEKTKVFKDKK